MKNSIIIFVILISLVPSAFSQFYISGIVMDSSSGASIENVNITVWKNYIETYSSKDGSFFLPVAEKGFYTLFFECEGYHRKTETFHADSVKPAVKYYVKLSTNETITDTIDVTAKYFNKPDAVNTSYSNVMFEELRKTPGAVEDVIRYFTNAPGVSTSNDVGNDIIARGGSPVENLTLIDGIEVLNPNHYAAPGSTNGLLSYINLKLVNDVEFYTGGFPIIYGDKLSSVLNIKFREGNHYRHIRDINISATGYGVFFEGPIDSRSSYMLSARRSYLDLIKDKLGINLVPEYWDLNAKVNYDFGKHDKISLTGLLAFDEAKPLKKGDFMYDTVNVNILCAGFNYLKTGSNYDYRFTASYNWNFYDVNYRDFTLDINDNVIGFRQELSYNPSSKINLTVFNGYNYIFSKYILYHSAGFNTSNFFTPSLQVNSNISTSKINGGIGVTGKFLKDRLRVNVGLRFDMFNMLNEKYVISPRLGLSYKLSPSATVNMNAAVLYQSPELLWVIVDEQNRQLKHIRVHELVLGFDKLFGNDMKLSVEPYIKQYYNYPVSVYDPYFIFINSGMDIYPNFLTKAVSFGKGYFAGVDVSFRKKNVFKGFFWNFMYSWSTSEFISLVGDIQPTEYDYTNQVVAILGYKFSFGLSISSKFKYAEGRPYTPFDEVKSVNEHRGIYERTLYNKGKMPDYVRWDIRVDQESKIGNTRLVVYLEVLNVLNRVNYFNYWWSSYYNRISKDYQIIRAPILGLSFQF